MEIWFRFPDCHLASEPSRHIVTGLGIEYQIMGRSRSVQVEFAREAFSVKASGLCDDAFPSGEAAE